MKKRPPQRIIYSDPTMLQPWKCGHLFAREHEWRFEGLGVSIPVMTYEVGSFALHVWTPEEWKSLSPGQRPSVATYNRKLKLYFAFVLYHGIKGRPPEDDCEGGDG